MARHRRTERGVAERRVRDTAPDEFLGLWVSKGEQLVRTSVIDGPGLHRDDEDHSARVPVSGDARQHRPSSLERPGVRPCD